MGSANAPVFPDPVCASAIRSFPAKTKAAAELRVRSRSRNRPPKGAPRSVCTGWNEWDSSTLERVGDGLGLNPGGLLPPHGVARLYERRSLHWRSQAASGPAGATLLKNFNANTL